MSAEGVVHVIDDDEAARDSLRFLLEAAGFDVRTYESAVAFLARLPQPEAGCVVTDLRMPLVSGIELMRKLAAAGVHLPVIVVTGHGDIPLAVDAMKLGAVDFFEKPYDDEAIIRSVRGALNRRVEEAKTESAVAEIAARAEQLTQRERQVLNGLLTGHPNKNIAADLGISPRTVEIYRANVMSKMQASSLSELVRMALVAGLFRES